MMSKQIRSLKSNNRKKILDLIRSSSNVNIAELSFKSFISKPTIKKIIDYYIKRKLIISAGKGKSTDSGGKKPELYRFNKDFGYIISIHITPDSIYYSTTDMNVNFIDVKRHSIKKNTNIEIILENVVNIITNYLVSEKVIGKKLIGISIAFPGIVNSTKGILIYSPHYHSWESNYPFKKELMKRLNLEVDIFMDCTNRFQAFAEKAHGIARGYDNFLIVDAVEEGLGAGIVIDGNIKHGLHNLSGEIGHMILNPDSKIKCICGGVGCFEAMVSVKRILKRIREGYSKHSDSLIFKGRDPCTVRIQHLFKALHDEDAFAKEIIQDIVKWFAIGLSNVIMVYDPQMIIIQGIYVKAGDYFLKNLRQKIEVLPLPNVKKKVTIEYSKFGFERGILGGASYVCWNYFEHENIY